MDADVKRAQLEAALTKAMGECGSMQWGEDDCALWCANILLAALGYDAARSFRGRYKTSEGAQCVLGEGGLPRAIRAAGREYGWHPVRRGAERVGDIGLFYTGERSSGPDCHGRVVSTVICRAPGWFVGRSQQGWVAVPSRLVRPIWAVA